MVFCKRYVLMCFVILSIGFIGRFYVWVRGMGIVLVFKW